MSFKNMKIIQGSLIVTNPDGTTFNLGDIGSASLTIDGSTSPNLSSYVADNRATISVHSFADDIREIKERLGKLEQLYQDDTTYFKRVL